MARYTKVFPIVDYPEKSYAEVGRYLESKKFVYKNCDGEMLFQKGNGVWAAPSFIKVSYSMDNVRVEAWIDMFGSDEGLEGFAGCAVKKPLKKIVNQVELMLQQANPEYLEQREAGTLPEQPMVEQQTPVELPASKKEFYQKYAGESFYRNLKINAIVGYILCGVLLLSALAYPPALLDLAIYLALLLGMHLGKSKFCAIGITAYGALGMVINLMNGNIGGYLWLIIGIYSIVLFSNADKRYKKMMGK